VRIQRELLDEILAHARAEAPNECCGMVAARDGEAVRVYRVTNAQASPMRYEMDPKEQLQVYEDIERSGWQLGAIYHSHTRSEPYPSQTDINQAFWQGSEKPLWPGTLYVIVGLTTDPPDVRAYDIPKPWQVDEVPVTVEG
jgi:proteasome lid subunit RPN8/RPN11